MRFSCCITLGMAASLAAILFASEIKAAGDVVIVDFAKAQDAALHGTVLQPVSKLEFVKEPDGKTVAKIHYLLPVHEKEVPTVGLKFPDKNGQPDKAVILTAPLKTIKVDVQGDLSGKTLCVAFSDASGEFNMFHLDPLAEKARPGWTTMVTDLSKPAFFSWSGDGNKLVDYPAALASIYLDGWGTKSPTEGEYKLDNIRVTPFAGAAGSGVGTPITVVVEDFEQENYASVMTWGAIEKPSGSVKMAPGSGAQGTKGAELSYSFVKDGNLAQTVSLSIEGNPHKPYFKGPVSSFSVDIRGDGTSRFLGFAIIDRTGEYHQYQMGVPNQKEWKTYTVDLTKPANAGSWGGDNNKRLDYPIFVRCITISQEKAQPVEGTIGIDNICVVTMESPDNFLRPTLDLGREMPFFWGEQDAPGKAKFTVRCPAKAKAKGNVSAKLMDRRYETAREIFKGDVEAEYGKPFVQEIDVAVPRMGVYPLEIGIGGKTTLTSFAWLKPYAATPWNDSPFGINGEEDFELMKKLGINWPRVGLYWRLIEPRQGKWFLDASDPKIKAAQAAGLESMVMLADWGPEQNHGSGKSPDDPASWDAFGNFCGTIVGRHSAQITNWQIWNEPNLTGFWLPQANAASYVGMLKVAYERIKQADPKAKVMAGVLSCVDVEYAEEMLKLGAGSYMDVLSIHPYHLPEAPEMVKKGVKSATLSDKFVEGTFVEQMDKMNALFKKYGGEKKMWLDEYGYAPHPELFPYFSHPEWMSGALTIRQSLLALSLPYVERLFPFNWKDMVTPAANWDHVTGFVRKDHSPRAVCVGYSTMARMLDRKTFSRKLDFGKGVYALEFAGEGGKVAAVWITKGGTTLSAKLAETGTVCDLMGNETSLVPDNGLVNFGVCEEPVFVNYQGSLEPAAPQIQFGTLQCAPGDTCEIEIKAPGALGSATWNAVASGYWHMERKGPNSFVVSAEKDAKTGEYPLFFECEGATATATLEYSDTVEITAVPGNGSTVKTSFRNPYSRAKKLSLTARTDDGVSSSVDVVAAPHMATDMDVAVASEDADGFRTKAVNLSANFAANETAAPIEFKTGKRVIAGMAPCVPMPVVTLDGSVAEWTGKPCLMDKPWQQFAVAKGATVGTSGSFWTGYDSQNFYLAVSVKDPKHVQPASALPGELWKGDSLQFAFGVDVVRYEFDAALKEDGTICVNQNSPQKAVDPKNIVAAIKRTDDGTVYEVMLPWDAVGVKIDPAGSIRFALLVNENDGSGRIGWLEWGEGIGLAKDQALFPAMNLSK